jgi:hypothetical protein
MEALTKWEIFERVAKVFQLVILTIGVYALFNIPNQIELTRLTINKGTFDTLWQLDTRLRERVNDKIYLAIEHHKPIISNNITEDDLDLFLSDLCSIEEACYRNIISTDDVYEWFSDYIINTYENKEVKAYITKIRHEDPEYYKSFDDLYNRLQQHIKVKNKA